MAACEYIYMLSKYIDVSCTLEVFKMILKMQRDDNFSNLGAKYI